MLTIVKVLIIRKKGDSGNSVFRHGGGNNELSIKRLWKFDEIIVLLSIREGNLDLINLFIIFLTKFILC